MRRSLQVLSLAAAALAVASCSGVKVTMDYDTEASFGSYRTFALLERPESKRPPRSTSGVGPIQIKNIQNAVRRELTAKGLREVDSEKPDLRVAIHAGSKEKTDVDRWNYYGPRGRWRGSYVTVDRYEQGTVVIDLVDTATRAVVWRGVGKGVIDPDERRESFDDAVKAILAQYPPK